MTSIALDTRSTRRMSLGVRAYVAELLARLPAVAPDLHLVPVGRGENFGLAEQVGLPWAIARSGTSAVHYPTTFAPLVRTLPYVLTVHDLIHLRYPHLFGPATALHYRLVGIPLARGASRLLVGDPRTIADCERFLGIDGTRCRVVPLGYDAALLDADDALRTARPFLFYAGNHKPHKNLAVLYSAWAGLPPQIEIDLRISGPAEPADSRRYGRRGGQLIFTGHLSARDLRRHYRAAAAYVHPAPIEGFGLPLLEAAVVGTPVLAATDAIPAIVAPYATAFDPSDVEALTARLAEAIRRPDGFRRRAAEGVMPLRAYTWDRFAAATAAVYREVIG